MQKRTKILVISLAVLLLCGIGIGVFFLGGDEPDVPEQLAYSVNADGQTCTIIDVGTFRSTELVIPETIDGYRVTAIEKYAFAENHKLERVTVPEGVTTIGRYAFLGCESLKSVTLPESLTSFDGAFSNCTALTQINIPSGITSIGDSTFNDCALTAVTIPENVTYIGVNAFHGCPLVTVHIPDSVGNIGYGAFSNCAELTEIHLPDNLEVIPEALLKNCASLCSFVIPQSVTKIGQDAFANCAGLNSFIIPETVTFIGANAFNGTGYAKNTDNWDDTDLYIGDWLVQTYSSDTEYTFTAKAKKVAVLSFRNCQLFYVEEDHPTLCAVDGVLYSRDMKELIAFPVCWGMSWDHYYTNTFTIPDGVEEIRGYAFCEAVYGENHSPFLKNVIMPESMRSIGDYAFYLCTGLESITLNDGITEIGESAFRSCWALKDVRLPQNVTVIRDYAFSECAIKEIDLHDGITHIGIGAFKGCQLTSVHIPNNITRIEDYAFCGNYLTDVTIPDGVTYIGNYAFSNTSAPKGMFVTDEDAESVDYANSSIHIPASVTEIGESAIKTFANINIDQNNLCYVAEDGLLYNKDKTLLISCYFGKSNVTIADSVKKTYTLAFAGCQNLKSVMLPDGLITLGKGTFLGCNGLESVQLPDALWHIQSSAFYECNKLADIKIPESVRTVGNGAFLYCNALTDVQISGNMEYIGQYVFEGCSNINSLKVGGNQLIIDDYAFSGCTRLKDIKLEDGVAAIGNSFLSRCEFVSELHIPETVNHIAPGAFAGTLISKLTIDSGNDHYTVENSTLYDKQKTKLIWRSPESEDEVVLPSGLLSIEAGALCGYPYSEITIPATVTEIGDNAFGYSRIAKIHYGGTMSQWNEMMAGKKLCSYNMVKATIHCTDGDIPNFSSGK